MTLFKPFIAVQGHNCREKWRFTKEPIGKLQKNIPVLNGNFRILEVPTIYKAYFSGLNLREYPHKIWPEIWYSTSNLGSWRSPIDIGI